MLSFLKYTLATMLGSLLSILLFIFIIYLSFLPDDEVKIEANTVLRLKLNQPIAEQSSDNPARNFGLPVGYPSTIGLINLKNAILKAKEDKNIKGIFLDLKGISAGFASIEELRNALLDFKKSKKFVYAYGEYFSEGAYYLASIADKIYLNPAGGMEFNGLTAEVDFYKNTLEKLDAKAEVFRVGDFKSAVEPYILEKMSEPNRKQLKVLLNSLYDFYLENVAKSRNLSIRKLEEISDKSLVREPEEALKYKLVTHLGYYDEVERAIKKKLKINSKKEINFVDLESYESVKPSNEKEYSEDKIVVIVAEGEIRSGQSSDGVIGSETIAREIRKARLDKRVKALVLRINSPGGSALASDIMWREVVLTKKVKPIVASMSDIAASGGYYMAMGCDAIIAQPNTITGSIGIFALFFNISDMYREKLGITQDHVSTGEFREIRSAFLTRDFTKAERLFIQYSVNKGYQDFTSKAAKGRDMKLKDLKAVASGRVWSGSQAKEIGLIDELGGLDKAIDLAAKKAKLKNYRLRYLPVKKDFLDKITSVFQAKSQEKIIKKQLGQAYPYIKLVERFRSKHYLQARMPYDINIK